MGDNGAGSLRVVNQVVSPARLAATAPTAALTQSSRRRPERWSSERVLATALDTAPSTSVWIRVESDRPSPFARWSDSHSSIRQIRLIACRHTAAYSRCALVKSRKRVLACTRSDKKVEDC